MASVLNNQTFIVTSDPLPLSLPNPSYINIKDLFQTVKYRSDSLDLELCVLCLAFFFLVL